MTDEIGTRVRAARERRGWTQEHLGAVADLSARQIQRIEARASAPSAETILAMANALDVEVSELRVGFTAEDLAELRQEFLCPHCGSRLSERTPVSHEYGVDEVEVFECGYTRGMSSRPCPAESRFPTFEDYELALSQEASGRWWCRPFGKTTSAREVHLQSGCGDSREEAEARVRFSYIMQRDGYTAADEFRREHLGGI